jgi:hypothetical protein
MAFGGRLLRFGAAAEEAARVASAPRIHRRQSAGTGAAAADRGG